MLCLISSKWHMRPAVGSSSRGRITTGIYNMTGSVFMPRRLDVRESTALEIRGHVYSSTAVCWLSRDLRLDLSKRRNAVRDSAWICPLFFAHHVAGISNVIDWANASPATLPSNYSGNIILNANFLKPTYTSCAINYN